MGGGKRPLKVLCVKTGNKYPDEYVYKLKNMVRRHIKESHTFLCYTDSPISDIDCAQTDLPGWWGKLDLFCEKGPCLYFDLDTVILSSLQALVIGVRMLNAQSFIMIRPWNPRRKSWASGIMGWNGGDWSFIREGFNERQMKRFSWDQKYITWKLKERGVNVVPVQTFVRIDSFRHHCKDQGKPPADCKIVCFHGRPRPHEVRKLHWMREHWQ